MRFCSRSSVVPLAVVSVLLLVTASVGCSDDGDGREGGTTSRAEKEEDRKVSLREFLSWSLAFCLVSSFITYVLAMLIWVLPYSN